MVNQKFNNLFKDPRTNWKFIWTVVILGILAGGGILGYYYLWIAELESKIAKLELKIPRKIIKEEIIPPVIESISPTSGSLGTEVIIRGSGFTPTNNGIAFTHKDINFQGRNTAYLNGVNSPDGKTLRFNLPDNDDVLLGACPPSEPKLNEACPAIGILLPRGDVQISVVNRNGISNNLIFTVSE